MIRRESQRSLEALKCVSEAAQLCLNPSHIGQDCGVQGHHLQSGPKISQRLRVPSLLGSQQPEHMQGGEVVGLGEKKVRINSFSLIELALLMQLKSSKKRWGWVCLLS